MEQLLETNQHRLFLSFLGAVYTKSDRCWIISGTFEEYTESTYSFGEKKDLETGKLWMEFHTDKTNLTTGWKISDPDGDKTPLKWKLIG